MAVNGNKSIAAMISLYDTGIEFHNLSGEVLIEKINNVTQFIWV